jgi:monothiol glutaredoxin
MAVTIFGASFRMTQIGVARSVLNLVKCSDIQAFTGAFSMDVMEQIKEQVEQNQVLLYMKGSPNQPQCGFSAKVVQALMACGQRFAYVDILSNPEIRANLPAYANWPTFPQLWVKGELIGGCDIITEMHEKGELEPLVREASEPV